MFVVVLKINVLLKFLHPYNLTHMCIMLSECVHLLLAHNAPVKVKNSLGWSPLAEAISYGDRQTSMY